MYLNGMDMCACIHTMVQSVVCIESAHAHTNEPCSLACVWEREMSAYSNYCSVCAYIHSTEMNEPKQSSSKVNWTNQPTNKYTQLQHTFEMR